MQDVKNKNNSSPSKAFKLSRSKIWSMINFKYQPKQVRLTSPHEVKPEWHSIDLNWWLDELEIMSLIGLKHKSLKLIMVMVIHELRELNKGKEESRKRAGKSKRLY